ncbi:hypothetical protein [Chitinophaga eiseniae]|uniref:Pyruvate carboxyltransferase domain-containing protein n=1 Tax=Chitinophaga eiseniae TaxID=634771 RepID=A0A847SEI7_9BACT|nr:hypothetical protein [Chitinophaga eiseniae]NLR78594.1 hypothetical protein [Chitinophaga eiseniae]
MNSLQKPVTLLDCTIRDGGYYTGWDFEDSLVNNYLLSCDKLPIDIVEIGYRGVKSDTYYGDYFYLPLHLVEKLKAQHPNMQFSVCIDEKDVNLEIIDNLLSPYVSLINMIRIPVDPMRLDKAIALSREAKKMGFVVCLNIMYLSKWYNDDLVLDKIAEITNEDTDYIYLVDSFGSCTPDIVEEVVKRIKESSSLLLGFHGHDNMELALANAITAMKYGCDAIDVTFTGMGRGAGNLKTELLLTYLDAAGHVKLNLNDLSDIVGQFEKLKQQYQWGTNLPYIISGAFSLPQKEIMSLINKRRYSLETIVNNLQHLKAKPAVEELPRLSDTKKYQQAVIIGGGKRGIRHTQTLYKYIEYCAANNIDICLIHSSSRHYSKFEGWDMVDQFCCLTGYEGKRLEESGITNLSNLKCILPPSPTKMGTYIPEFIRKYCYELQNTSDEVVYDDSPLSIALQLTLNLQCQSVFLFAFDGYDVYMNESEKELAEENQMLISQFSNKYFQLIAVTPTRYQIHQQSLNFQLTHESSCSHSRTV